MISSLINTFVINRLFRLYTINVKNAFKIDYGHKFAPVKYDNIDEEDDYDIEINEIQMEEQMKRGYNNNIQNRSSISKISVNKEEDSNINSTRKLLGEDLDRSDAKADKRRLPTNDPDGANEESFVNKSFRK